MYDTTRRLRIFAGIVLCLLLSPNAAWAWLETSTKSQLTTIEIERNGDAIVAYEIILRIKGGPLRSYDLAGIDSDAELLPDATVARAEAGQAGALTYPLLLQKRDDNTLRMEVDHPKGLFRGTFVFKLRYKTRLLERKLISSLGSGVEVRWVAPRSPDGVDSARVVFRLPQAPSPPRLPEIDPEQVALGLADDPGGVFIATFRNAADKDELEVVRPHVAKGEPVVWRVITHPRAFDAFSSSETPALLPPVSTPHETPRARLVSILVLLTVGLAYALLVLLKWRGARRAAEERRARARALIPLPAPLRAALAGAALAGAVTLVLRMDQATIAGGLVVLAMALAATASPKPESSPRRPGRWLALSDDDAWQGREARLPGSWFDAGTIPGFALFALALSGFAAAFVLVFPRSPYDATLLALASACLLPVFCTGRAAELPADPVRRPVKLLEWLALRLREDRSLRAVAWARVPDGESQPDELRLLVMPRRPLAGLTAIELGLEYQSGFGGAVALPYVLIRALEGSPAHAALPRSVVWSRGRKQEERVAVLRPKLPTRTMCLSLLAAVAGSLVDREPRASKPGQAIRLPMSAGSGSSRAKPGTISSPAQAM
jgi:hypothetical protein